MKKETTCCFTGHRPEKLTISENEAKLRLQTAITTAIQKGYITFLSGMAQGIDLWAAELVLNEKQKSPTICLGCALPYEGFEKRWEEQEKIRYRNVLQQADFVKVVSEHYFRSCFQKRNCYMVDNSSLLIAAYNGEAGGTRNTINYAKRNALEMIQIL